MTKSDLIQSISERMPHLPAKDVEVVVNTIFNSMADELKEGGRVEIRGFGSFSVRTRRSRQGRNPKTGELISVPEKQVPFFTVGNELRKRVNDGRADDSAEEGEELATSEFVAATASRAAR